MPRKTLIRVEISREYGWHVATSKDLKGLYVMHRDLAKFAEGIKTCIALLYKAKYGTDVEVEQINSAEDMDPRSVAYEAMRKAA